MCVQCNLRPIQVALEFVQQVITVVSIISRVYPVAMRSHDAFTTHSLIHASLTHSLNSQHHIHNSLKSGGRARSASRTTTVMLCAVMMHYSLKRYLYQRPLGFSTNLTVFPPCHTSWMNEFMNEYFSWVGPSLEQSSVAMWYDIQMSVCQIRWEKYDEHFFQIYRATCIPVEKHAYIYGQWSRAPA